MPSMLAKSGVKVDYTVSCESEENAGTFMSIEKI